VANTYKNTPNEKKNSSKEKGKSLFEMIEQNIGLDVWFENGVPTRYLKQVLFLTFLGLIYIANSHISDRLNRKNQELKLEVEDLRADYTTLKADYMYESKQSEVAKKVKELGLIEGGGAPHLIEVEENEH